MPGGHLDHPVQRRPARHPGLQLPLRLGQPQLPVRPQLPEEAQLHPRLPGEVGQGQGQFRHGSAGVVRLQLAPQDAGSPGPIAHAPLEMEVLLPGNGPLEDALQRRPAGVPAPHPGLGVGPPEQGVHRGQQQFQGAGAEGQGGMLHDGFLLLQGQQRTVVQALRQVPGQPAFLAEPVDEHFLPQGGHVPQGAEAEAAQFRPHRHRDGQQVNRVEGQKTGHIPGDLLRAQGPTESRRHQSGKLALAHPDPGFQVRGRRVEQGIDQPGLAAVHGFQPVQPHVGRAQLRRLHPVADSLQGAEQLPEHPPVGGRVGLQDDAAGLPGPGLLQRHPGGHSGGGRKVVHHQGPGLAAVHNQDRLARQVGLPAQFHLGPQVRDQHTGDPQDSSPTGKSAGSGASARPRSVRTRPRAMPGRRVRYSPSSSRRSWRSATEVLLIPQPLASSRTVGG